MSKGNSRTDNYVYAFLDPRKPGLWEFQGKTFNFQPFYIGRGIKNRMNGHMRPSSLLVPSLKNAVLNKIISENKSPIILKVFENLSFDESEEIETKMIDSFGRINIETGILTNMVGGGSLGRQGYVGPRIINYNLKKFTPLSKRVDQFDLQGNFIKKWDWVSDIQKELGFSGANISACCIGKQKTAYGFRWKYDGTSPYLPPEPVYINSKKVFKYKNGIFCGEFKSQREAGDSSGISPGNICLCCQGKVKTSGGCQWFYDFQGDLLTENRIFRSPKSFARPIEALDINLNKVYSFSSARKASEYLNISRIPSSVFKSPLQFYKGFYWRYEELSIQN